MSLLINLVFMIKKSFAERNLPLIVVIIVGVVFTAALYGKILANSNDYMFTESGDGIKNYFTYAYHITHDSSYINFSGMNYPYGEHFFYILTVTRS